MFEARGAAGDTITIESTVQEFTLDGPSVAVISAGSFLTANPNRDPLTLVAQPARCEGGMLFPGTYTLTALENGSVYHCVCAIPLPMVDPDMFELQHRYLEISDTVNLEYNDGYRAVLIMSGKLATAEGLKTNGQASPVYALPYRATAVEPSHVVLYRLKETPNVGAEQ